MACEEFEAAYADAMDDFVDDWDDFDDADKALMNAAAGFWIAAIGTWACLVGGQYITGLIGVEGMNVSQAQFDDAKSTYDREWGDLKTGFDKFQQASRELCDCYDEQ